MPRLPYGVVAVPAYAEESQTTAYYQPGSPEAGRPGYYYANTSHLSTRPKWEMEALSLHEAVPGHHFQIALAQELEAVPEGEQREALYRKLVAQQYENGQALNMAATLEIDAVIDPAETRAWLVRGLASARREGWAATRCIDTW